MRKSVNDFIYNKPLLHSLGEWWVRRGPEVRATFRSILMPFIVAHIIAFILKLLQGFLKRLKGNGGEEYYEFRSGR